MPQNRTLLALVTAAALPLLALAQTPDPAAPSAGTPATAPEAAKPEPTEAEKVLDEAIDKVKKVQAVAANVQQDVEILGQKFQIKGRYLRAPQYRVYLLLELTGLGNARGTMLQVCDGATFWDYKKVLDQPDLRKRTLAPIIEKLESPDADAELRDRVLSSLGFAGPDALLVGLRKAVHFNQKEEGELDGRKVWIIRGRWTDLASLTSPDQPPLRLADPIPPYVPSLVYAWIGQEDGWPYRVELSGRKLGVMEQRKDIREIGPDGRPVGRPITPPNVQPSKIILTYSQVELDPRLTPDQFAFQPPNDPNIRVIDETQMIANDLTNVLAERAARRKAEAAREGATDLDRSIPVPTPPADAAPSAPPAAVGTPAAPPTPK
jgi:outer membrane lipoprotein-sorting protein